MPKRRSRSSKSRLKPYCFLLLGVLFLLPVGYLLGNEIQIAGAHSWKLPFGYRSISFRTPSRSGPPDAMGTSGESLSPAAARAGAAGGIRCAAGAGDGDDGPGGGDGADEGAAQSVSGVGEMWRGGGDRSMAAADAGAHVLPAQAGCAEWRCWFSSRSPVVLTDFRALESK